MGPAAVACGFGMFFFGYTLENGSAAELCAFLQGLMMVGVLIGIFATLSYGLDAFRSQANEIFIMNMLFKVHHLSDPALSLISQGVQQLTAVPFRILYRTSCFMAFPIMPTLGS
jgi:hypothetical protein